MSVLSGILIASVIIIIAMAISSAFIFVALLKVWKRIDDDASKILKKGR